MAAWIKVSLGMELGLDQGDFELDVDHAPPPQKGAEPRLNFWPIFIAATAGWMKLVLGMEVGLSPGDFVLDEEWGIGDPAPPSSKSAQTPNFWPISVAAKWLHGSRCHLVWS